MSWSIAFRGFDHSSHSKDPVCNPLCKSEIVTEHIQKILFATFCWTYAGERAVTSVLSPQKSTQASDFGTWMLSYTRYLRQMVISELQSNI